MSRALSSRFVIIVIATFIYGVTAKQALSLPIDWHLHFGADTLAIDTYRRTEQNNTISNSSQAITSTNNSDQNANFQSYKFKLSPTIIVNDSITFNAEMTNGPNYGGRFGDSSSQKVNTTPTTDPSFGNALYMHNTYDQDSKFILSKFYAEIFSDTATFTLGRQSFDWGTGAVFDNGDDLWDRHATIKDGLVARFKLSNFEVAPYYFKTNARRSLAKSTNAKEMGISLLYDNPEKDLKFGILFGKKKNSANNQEIAGIDQINLGSANVKITDIYLKKTFSRLTLEAEVPILSGDLGSVYDAGTPTKYKAMAILGNASYRFNQSWSMGANLGTISGDDGVKSTFKGMFLHPNFHVSNLMFRYNLNAVADNSTENVFDSYMTNMTFAKLWVELMKGSWTWKAALIWAKADQVAKNAQLSYNHFKNKSFTAVEDQADDYGHELDIDFVYKWNENFDIGGKLGYHFVGDYYKFDNVAATEIQTENTYLLGLNAMLHF